MISFSKIICSDHVTSINANNEAHVTTYVKSSQMTRNCHSTLHGKQLLHAIQTCMYVWLDFILTVTEFSVLLSQLLLLQQNVTDVGHPLLQAYCGLLHSSHYNTSHSCTNHNNVTEVF